MGKFGNRAAVTVDLGIISSNVYNIKKILNPGTNLMAVIKADAYGHGAVEAAKAASIGGANYFGVATVDEGCELRAGNVSDNILVLGFIPPDKMAESIANNLELTLFDLENALQLSDICSKMDKTAKVHLKIDTGMGRIGFLPNEDSIKAILRINALPNIEIVGIYTHLSCSGGSDESFTNLQFKKFTDFIECIKTLGIHIPIKHVSNSGAICSMRRLDLDMVRAGIIIYGLSPSEFIDVEKMGLKPALDWKSYISFVKTLDAGEGIGYSRTYVTHRKSVVGTVPLGYADGYSRGLSNRGRVIVNGQYAPIIGRICMDQFMVDLTDIPGVSAGDEVVLIGRQGGASISADELAEIQGTINYEIVCQISKRVERLYIRE